MEYPTEDCEFMPLLMSDMLILMVALGLGISVAIAALFQSLRPDFYGRLVSRMIIHFATRSAVLVIPVFVITRLFAPQATDLSWLGDVALRLGQSAIAIASPFMALLFMAPNRGVDMLGLLFKPLMLYVAAFMAIVALVRLFLTNSHLFVQFAFPTSVALLIASSVDAALHIDRVPPSHHPMLTRGTTTATEIYRRVMPVRHIAILLYSFAMVVYLIVPPLAQHLANIYTHDQDLFLWTSLVMGMGLVGLALTSLAIVSVILVVINLITQGIEITEIDSAHDAMARILRG